MIAEPITLEANRIGSIKPENAENAFERYAIYYAPEMGSALAQFGLSWLGHDPSSPHTNIARRCYGLGEQFHAKVTNRPKRYGFHGTLKAPFNLADGMNAKALREEIEIFARHQQSFEIPPLKLNEMYGRLVLSSDEESVDLAALAGACVSNFDHFRAAVTSEKHLRRSTEGLNQRQQNLFNEWGYPYIFDEFQFHLTLTNKLDAKELAQIRPVLIPALKDAISEPVQISSICLFGDPGQDNPFHLIERFYFKT